MIAIKKVSITPNEAKTGESVFISISIEDISWNDIKTDFKNWNTVKTRKSWQSIKDYEGV